MKRTGYGKRIVVVIQSNLFIVHIKEAEYIENISHY